MQRPKTSTILLSVLLFLFFLVLEFPYQNLKGYIFSQIYKNTQIFITADDLSLTLFGWPGLKLQNVSVSVPMAGSELELQSEKTTVRAGLGGIFPPYPTVSLDMDRLKKGGNLYFKVGQSSSFIKGAFEARGLSLEQIPLGGISEPLNGDVQAEGDFLYDKSELAKSQGDVTLSVSNLKIPAQNLQGIVLPPLVIGDVKSKIGVRNGSVEITSFQLGSPTSDIKGSLAGDLRLGKNVMGSYLNLTLRLRLSDKYRQDPRSATLVSFLQSFQSNTPGEYAMKWGATLQEMTTNLVAAIPQKANP